MAGPAGNQPLTGKVGVVDLVHHGEHAPGGLLGRFIVLVEFGWHMAMTAVNSEALPKERHDRRNLRCRHAFQDLNILVHLFGGLRRVGGLPSFLGLLIKNVDIFSGGVGLELMPFLESGRKLLYAAAGSANKLTPAPPRLALPLRPMLLDLTPK